MSEFSWKSRALALKRNVRALTLAAKDPRVSWAAKALTAIVVAYALSPVDLIPDFIPVVGYMDDLILVPLGIWAVIKLISADVWADCRARAMRDTAALPVARGTALVIVLLWIVLAVLIGGWLLQVAG